MHTTTTKEPETMTEAIEASQPDLVIDDSDWHRVHYKCTNERCKATDSDNIFGDHQPAQMINCWKCKAGQGVDAQQMILRNVGMKLVPEKVQ